MEIFPQDIERVLSSAFLQKDVDLLLQKIAPRMQILSQCRSLVVANVGDCRAVLCRRGKTIEMSRDHKLVCLRERHHVYNDFLNRQINVARALGDWHMKD